MKGTKTILFIGIFLVVSSCAPKPSPIAIEATETALIPTLTPTATEAPQYEPGTVVLDPEYSFDGQIEIIEENQEAFYNNLLDSLIRINRDYFKALKTSQGVEVTDVASLRIYLGENDWIIPAGLQIPVMSPKGGLLAVELSQPLIKSVSLQNVVFFLIDYSEYQNSIDKGYTNSNNLFAIYDDVSRGYGLAIGFAEYEINEVSEISLIIAQKTDIDGVGFPQRGDSPSDYGVETLNTYLDFLIYVMRTLQTEPKSELEVSVSATGNFGDYVLVNHVNQNTGIGEIGYTVSVYSNFKKFQPSDSAPDIIRLRTSPEQTEEPTKNP